MNRRNVKIIVLSTFLLGLLSSCGKTCDKKRGELPIIDLTSIRPEGEYRSAGVPLTVDTATSMSIHGDSVIMTYKRKGKTWKLHYKITGIDTLTKETDIVYE